MNKQLEDLNKPVAYDYQYAGVETCEGYGSWRNELSRECPPEWMIEEGKVKNLKPRYSQEYVSALRAEVEEKDKRIAWLEQQATNDSYNINGLLSQCEMWQEKYQSAEQRLKQPALADVIAERQRQISDENYETWNDDMYTDGDLAEAAACYAMHAHNPTKGAENFTPHFWPWDAEWWKPKSPRRDLVRAGALILAEIERLDRATVANTLR